MSCEVTALSFQAHANYGTWSIDFGYYEMVNVSGGEKTTVSLIRH